MLCRHAQRSEAIQLRQRMIAVMFAEQRLDIAALALQDTPFGLRKYVSDEVALALAESPWTGAHLVDEAHMFSQYPSIHARIGDDLAAAAR